MDLVQGFLEWRARGVGVQDALALLSDTAPAGQDEEGGDVVLTTAPAAETSLAMAGGAGGGVVDRPQAVPAPGQRVVGGPFVGEEHLPGVGHRRARLGTG